MNRPLRFELNWVFQGPNSPFLYAADAGYFADAGFDVSFRQGQSSALVGDTIARGEADLGFGDIAAAMERSLLGHGDGIGCLMPLFDRSPACLASLNQGGSPSSLQDLLRGALAGPPHDTAGRLLPLLLAQNNLSATPLSYREVSPQERDIGLVDGTFKAVTGFDATILFSMMARGMASEKLAFLYFADCGLDIYAAAVLCSHSVMADTGLARTLQAIIRRAWHECRVTPSLGVDAVLRRNPAADSAITRQHLQWVLDHQVFPDGASELCAPDNQKAAKTLAAARALSGNLSGDFDTSAFFRI